MCTTNVRAGPWSRHWPAVLCAALFFLGTADRFFAFRVEGATVRLAQLALGTGLAVWWRTKPTGLAADDRRLLIAWAPFCCVFFLASMASADPLPGLLKLGWFGFNFLGAYAWCQLFRRRDMVVGYFGAYLLVVAVIVFDFHAGFGAGPAHMTGYAQSTYGEPGRDGLFRPHAFYYEPSFAAAGLGLAWTLALTAVSRYAPKASAALAVFGVTALAVTFSRTGWVYALLAFVAIAALGGGGPRISLRRRAVHLGIAGVALLALGLALVPARDVAGIRTLLRAFGVSQTIERICPIVEEQFPTWGMECLEGEERDRALPYNQPEEPSGRTSEGSRLLLWEDAVERIRQHPFAGVGVARGADRLISMTVPNTWLEIGVEGGAFALLAFAWGLFATIYQWQGLRRENRAVGAALLLYFLVTWQFVPTFPRLDQWLSLWMALTAVRAGSGEAREKG